MKTAAATTAAKSPRTSTARTAQPRRIELRRLPESEAKWTAEEIVTSHLSNLTVAQTVELLDSKLTVADLARILLAQRGMSADGTWLGFPRAAVAHNVHTSTKA